MKQTQSEDEIDEQPPTSRRGFLLGTIGAATAVSAAGVAAGDAGQRSDDGALPSFRRDAVEEHRGDVATFAVDMGDYDEATVRIGSEAVNYEVAATVVDGSGNGVVTVALDTFLAGRDGESGISAVADADSVRAVRQRTPTLSGPLDYAVYPLAVVVDDRIVAESLLTLLPRGTTAAHAAVAPRLATATRSTAFREQIARAGAVARGDWAVVEIEASGVGATLDSVDAFEDESLGYDLSVVEADVVNAEPERVPLDRITVLPDPDADRFFAVLDSELLAVGTEYEATFSITDASPYVSAGERESVSTRFSVVERSAEVTVEGDELSLPAGEATVSGTTTVAPGTQITVSAWGPSSSPFQQVDRPTVADDGTWAAAFDFGDLTPGTVVSITVLDLSPVVAARVGSE